MVARREDRQFSPGRVHIEDRGRETFTSPKRPGVEVTVHLAEYHYEPPPDLGLSIPQLQSLTFDCYTGPDGIRRFVPRATEGLNSLIAKGFQIGFALKARDDNWSENDRNRVRSLKIAFDYSSNAQCRMHQRFRSTGDLTLRKAIAYEVGVTSVLPPDVGLLANGSGEPWTVGRVLDEGRTAAEMDGLKKLSQADMIRQGIFAAAKLNPMPQVGTGVSVYIRMALFDTSRDVDKAAPHIVADVHERLTHLISKHLNETAEDFRKWLTGGGSNLVGTIAIPRRKRREPGLPRPVVKAALQELGWKGCSAVAECLEAFALSFADSLPQPLTQPERELFTSMYCRQDDFGGLSLPLILDRSHELQPVITKLWSQPNDPELIGAMHRVLDWYAQMVATTRRAGRIKKSKQHAMVSQPETMPKHAIDVEPVNEKPIDEKAIAAYLDFHGVSCSHCDRTPVWTYSGGTCKEEQDLVIQVKCPEHGDITTTEINDCPLLKKGEGGQRVIRSKNEH